MDKYNRTIEALLSGSIVLLNGATGTELEKRGIPQLENAWNGGGALSHPEILKNLYKEYVQSGAGVLITNTFATNKHVLQAAEQGHKFVEYNETAVHLAQMACSELKRDDVLIAGGISYWTFTDAFPNSRQLHKNVYEQSKIIADAGADLLTLEMMTDIDQMFTTYEAAKKVGLPVWIGLSCERDAHGHVRLLESSTGRLGRGESLQEAVRAISKDEVDVINIMHTKVEFVDNCLDVLDQEWRGLVGVYAHSGRMVGSQWAFDEVISKEDYAISAERWLRRGVNLIGGCCGIGVDHMACVSTKLSAINV